jgi:hypothetical protein
MDCMDSADKVFAGSGGVPSGSFILGLKFMSQFDSWVDAGLRRKKRKRHHGFGWLLKERDLYHFTVNNGKKF